MKQFLASSFGKLIYAARYRIILTYLLSIAASIFMMLYPLLVGNAVDGALAHSLRPLVFLAMVWALHIVLNLFRQVYDTRTFARINAVAATELIVVQRKANHNTSTISARVGMLSELSSFFAYEVPGTIMYIISPLGALFMIFRFEVTTGLIAAVYLCSTLSFNRWIYPMSKTLLQRLNSRSELSVEIIGSTGDVEPHYQNLAADNIAISDFDAKAWGAVEIATMGLFLFAVIRLGGISALTVGEAYAVIAYVQRFTDGVSQVPYIMQRIARLTDIRKRIETEREVL
jgi:ABC-type bacteriocin/lantibiotic exporter with double-glycine peptidase domain